MRTISRRISKLERRIAPKHQPRIVVRYGGAGDESYSQPEEEIDEKTILINVRHVDAKDGRPVEPYGSEWGPAGFSDFAPLLDGINEGDQQAAL
jgi:hypothetical protein